MTYNQITIENLKKENDILKKRCHMFGHGTWCSLCDMDCEFNKKGRDSDEKTNLNHHSNI